MPWRDTGRFGDGLGIELLLESGTAAGVGDKSTGVVATVTEGLGRATGVTEGLEDGVGIGSSTTGVVSGSGGVPTITGVGVEGEFCNEGNSCGEMATEELADGSVVIIWILP
jgi:hypothetical protein